MHGPTCIFWANLTPFLLQGRAAAKAQGQDWLKDACEKWVPAKWRNGRDPGHYARYLQSTTQ